MNRRIVVACSVWVLVSCGTGSPVHPRSHGVHGTSPPTGSLVRPASPVPTLRFHATISPIDAATRTRMHSSWHEGCPVPLQDLRLLGLSYWGFDHEPHEGELVVAAPYARPVASVFGVLFRARFPIARMELVDAYGGDDDASMSADNTSGFNCRTATGSSGWSEHAYGRAIDIDPVENPYVVGDRVLPPAGAEFLDRSDVRPGMIVPGGVVGRAFASIGWSWGGDFRTVKDYQHFSATGH